MINKKHPLYTEDIRNVLSVKGIERLQGKRIIVTGATGLLASTSSMRS